MIRFKQILTRTLIATLIFGGMAIPVLAQSTEEDRSPTAIVIQQINNQPGTIEWVILLQVTLFLILLTLLLSGSIQKKLQLKLQPNNSTRR